MSLPLPWGFSPIPIPHSPVAAIGPLCSPSDLGPTSVREFSNNGLNPMGIIVGIYFSPLLKYDGSWESALSTPPSRGCRRSPFAYRRCAAPLGEHLEAPTGRSGLRRTIIQATKTQHHHTMFSIIIINLSQVLRSGPDALQVIHIKKNRTKTAQRGNRTSTLKRN